MTGVALSIPVPNLPHLEDQSEYTIVYDKENGYKRIALTDIQNDEIVPYFNVEQDIRFELFTPKNPAEAQLLKLDNYTTVKSSNFIWWYPTRILIHGW